VGTYRPATVSPARVWLLAIRPRTLPAAVAPVVVGTGMAASRGVADLLPALAALVGALLIQVATNLANDVFDHLKGGDTEGRIGPARVVQAGLLPAAAVWRATLLTLGLALLVGIYLVWVGGVPILVIGILSLVCAVAYTGGPFPLAYHGLGDLFVFLFFGWVAVAGTYWVQALVFEPDLLLAGTAMGALITAILVVNNLRDRETDAAAGKRTLAVRLGRRGTQAQFVLLLLVGGAVPPVGMVLFGWSGWTLLALASGVLFLPPLTRVLTFVDPAELNPALGATARGVAWYAGLLACGFMAGAVRAGVVTF
jgi:1,4-dihydroxy-2-naphthoate polyprenyltransferase